MMKEIFHRTISIAMALLLLLSTMPWKVEKHYCMGRLMDVALFVDAEDCGMNMVSFEKNQSFDEATNSCCDDEVIFIAAQDDLKISFNDLDTNQQSFMIALTYSYTSSFKAQTDQHIPNELYPPPLIIKDIQLLDEVFLI